MQGTNYPVLLSCRYCKTTRSGQDASNHPLYCIHDISLLLFLFSLILLKFSQERQEIEISMVTMRGSGSSFCKRSFWVQSTWRQGLQHRPGNSLCCFSLLTAGVVTKALSAGGSGVGRTRRLFLQCTYLPIAGTTGHIHRPGLGQNWVQLRHIA